MPNGIQEAIRELNDAIEGALLAKTSGEVPGPRHMARICEATRMLHMDCVLPALEYGILPENTIAEVRHAFHRAIEATMGSGVFERNIAVRAQMVLDFLEEKNAESHP